MPAMAVIMRVLGAVETGRQALQVITMLGNNGQYLGTAQRKNTVQTSRTGSSGGNVCSVPEA